MQIKKLIYFMFIIGHSLTISSCNLKDTSVEEAKSVNINSKDKFHQTCDSCNKIVVKRYDLSTDSTMLQNLKKIVWKDTIIDEERIIKFRDLFDQVQNDGYCCCMKTHYTVSFYKDNTELGVYYIDTTEIKDTIVLFGQSYQTSYLVKLKDINEIIQAK